MNYNELFKKVHLLSDNEIRHLFFFCCGYCSRKEDNEFIKAVECGLGGEDKDIEH